MFTRIKCDRLLIMVLPSIAVCLLVLTGCDQDQKFNVAPVVGTVQFNGKPVTGGTLCFRPEGAADQYESGKPAMANIAEDGTFSLSTYGNGDGAVIGHHQVQYMAPQINVRPPEGAQPGQWKPPVSEFQGLVPKVTEVDVTEGKNELTIDLVKSR
ncbi:hypothetical protein GC197_06880 [bacterium]|nr:hypothetical protein [bacterium]